MNGLTQARTKQIRALRQKKERDASGLFLVEGAKAVLETIQAGWPVKTLLCTTDFLNKNQRLVLNKVPEFFVVSDQILAETGNFKTNNAALLVLEQKPARSQAEGEFWLVLENISDPGNLGTLIRLADWFGLREIICLGNCVEWYNPKVISASMGSFLRVQEIKMSLPQVLSSGRNLLAADMNGENLYEYNFPPNAALLIGNEAAGLSESLLNAAASRISIPSFGKAESLNAAVAGGIILSHWKQQSLQT